jgi:hypothetical protein
MAMAYQDKISKPKHRIHDVRGPKGENQLIDRVYWSLTDEVDPFNWICLSDTFTDVGLRNSTWHYVREHLRKNGMEGAFLDEHFSLCSGIGVCKNGQDVPVETRKTFAGADIPVTLQSRKYALALADLLNQADRDVRAIVVECGTKYLDLLLANCRNLELDVYVIDRSVSPPGGIIPRGGSGAQLFDSKADFEASGNLEWLVEGLMYQSEVTGWAGLQKNGKSWILMSLMKSLLSGQPWLGKYKVAQSKKIVYFVPEVGRANIYHRLKKMRLDQFLDVSLFVRTSSLGIPDLTDPRVLEECAGADVFLDTLIRFIEGSENSAEDIAFLAQKIFAIQATARSVNFAAHSQKHYSKAEEMGPDMFRGSGDIAAFASNGFGVMQVDSNFNRIYVKNVFNRDLTEDPSPFILEGRPHIDETGDFKLVDEAPGPLRDHKNKNRGGAQPDAQKNEKLQFLLDFPPDATGKEMAEALNKKFGSNHADRTVKDWRKEAEIKKDI